MASAAAQRIEALRRLRQQRALLDQYMGMVNAGDQIAAINSRTLGHESDWIPTARAIGDAKASDFQRNTRFPVFNWDDYMKDVRESLHLMRLNRKHWEAEQNDKIAAQTGLIPDPFNYQVDPKIPGVPDPFSYVPPEQKGMPVTDSPPLSSNEWREQYWMGSGERATDQGRVQIGPNTYWSSGMVANNPKEAKRLHYQYLDSPEANPELDAQTTITQMINSASDRPGPGPEEGILASRRHPAVPDGLSMGSRGEGTHQAPVRNTDAVADYYETGGGAPTLGAPVAPVASFGDAMTDIAAMIAAAEPPPTPPARAFTTGMGMRPYRSFTAGPPTTVLATPGTKYLSTPISSPSIDTSAQVRNKKLEELLYGTA